MRRTRGLLVAPVLAAFALAGCTVTVGQGDLEEGLASDLQNEGEPVESVECEDGLEGEVDFATDCTAHFDDETRELTVTVTEVDGSEILYELTWNG
ncbi:DUF4333 domain-containing protein [Haloechinothrix sp. LS1_15]|uniref:DUF4333 domain-containing protein n=1 Tax=Haloechinothrix sp. LS1_15 TaxID=2652248 RepID=UPI0029487CB5|nr:DUF4333 domain-containing protein [Haloechinothrix sp. LS1_15]MDV6014731.1 DUF4333 domain-containing protein [Haloechinothrix sp. LS1_15]